MGTCPSCQAPLASGAADCPRCGIVLAKWGGRKGAPSGTSPPRPAAAAPRSSFSLGRLARVLGLGLTGAGAAVGGYYWLEIRPRLQRIEGTDAASRPSRARSVDVRRGEIAEADATVRLDGDPMGLAWDGRSLVAGLRAGGVLRVTPAGDEVEIQKVPVLESRYRQVVGLDALAWNGNAFVGLALASWFGSGEGHVFVTLDPSTLAPGRTVPAPADVGAIAWDGASYWAGTRKATWDAPGGGLLLRLDASFAVVATLDAPAAGCQGLAWDGTHLWWADVFDDALYRIDVSGGRAEVAGRHAVSTSYLSGVAWDGRRLWIAEYADDRLHRISSRQLAAWTGRATPAAADERPPTARASDLPPEQAEALLAQLRAGSFETESAAQALWSAGHEDEVREILRDLLWSDDTFQRMHAESALHAVGLPADRAALSSAFGPETGPEDTDLVALRAWMDGDELHASWSVFVGEALVSEETEGSDAEGVVSMPLFARYEVSVDGGTLGRKVEKTYDAVGGENVVEDEILATGLGPGKYDVSVFIHVQYRTSEGGLKILNDGAGSVRLER